MLFAIKKETFHNILINLYLNELMVSKKVIIVGGGFGGIFTYLNLHKLTHKNKLVSFTVISDKNYFLFTPLLPEVSSGVLFPEDIITPVRENITCCMDGFILGRVDYIDSKSNTLKVGEKIVNFDYLVVASGASINYRNIDGAKKYSIPFKTLDDSILLKNSLIDLFEKDELIKDACDINILIVGGGPTGIEVGVEVSQLIDELLPFYTKLNRDFHNIDIKILNSSSDFLKGFPEKIKKYVLDNFGKNIPIDIVFNAHVIRVDKDTVYLEDGKSLNYDILIWSAGVSPNIIKMDKSYALSDTGRYLTTKYLNLKDKENIFTIGDVADIENMNLPMLAQTATDQSKICAINILNSIEGNPLLEFKLHQKGLLLSLGKRNAVAQIGNKFFTKKIAWVIWKLFYLSEIFGKGSKIKIVFNWILNEFSPRDISKI